jgi:hypothetical protein
MRMSHHRTARLYVGLNIMILKRHRADSHIFSLTHQPTNTLQVQAQEFLQTPSSSTSNLVSLYQNPNAIVSQFKKMKASAFLSTLYLAVAAASAYTCEKDSGPCIMANDCCKGYTCKMTPGVGSRCVADKKCVATGLLCHVQTAQCCGDFACTRILGQVGVCVSHIRILC